MTRQCLDEERLPESVLRVLAQGAAGAAVFVGQHWIAANYQPPVDALIKCMSEICCSIAQRLNNRLEA